MEPLLCESIGSWHRLPVLDDLHWVAICLLESGLNIQRVSAWSKPRLGELVCVDHIWVGHVNLEVLLVFLGAFGPTDPSVFG